MRRRRRDRGAISTRRGDIMASTDKKRRVVLTGASGYIAQRMFPELSARWDLVPIDVRGTTRDGKSIPGLIVADLTRRDRNAYRQHFRGADAVIHCGYVSALGLDATTWQNN